MSPNKKVTKEVGVEGGSEGSAAGGGRSDLSEWQRSAESEPASTGEAFAGHRNRTKLLAPAIKAAPLTPARTYDGAAWVFCRRGAVAVR